MAKRLLLTALGAAAIAAVVLAFSASENPAAAWLCTYKTEVVSGINKICIYKCPTGDAAITISVASLCPISINQ